LVASSAELVAQPRQDATRNKVQQGLALLQAGERDRAEALFHEVVREDPRHGTARFQLGRLALERGDLEAARQHLETATTANPRRLYLAWSLLGRVQLLQHDASGALRSFEQSLSAAPRFAPSLVGRARAALFLDRPDEALHDLETALTLPSSPPEAQLLLAQLLVFLDRPLEARQYLELLAATAGATTEDHRASAEMLRLALSSSPEDELRLRILLGKNMSLADGYLSLAVRRLSEGDEQAALLLLRVALEMDDSNPMALLFLQRTSLGQELPAPQPAPDLNARSAAAYRLYEEDRLEEAARVATRILDQRPFFIPARLLAIRDAEQRKDFWAALAGYRRLLAWLPGLPALESGLADTAHAMGADELAECSVRRALEAFPGEGALHYRLATVLAETGDTEAALAAGTRAIELGFDEPQVWLTLGQIHLERMELSASIAAYGQALERDPDAAEVIGSLVLSSLTTEDSAALRQLLERHAAAHPDKVDTQYSLGVMSLREGKVDQAEEYFLRVARLFPDHPQVHYNLGQIYLRQGRTQEGRAAMTRFREIKAREDESWLRHNRAHALRLEADEALSRGDAEGAVAAYSKIIADGTAQLEDYVAIGQACLKAGQHAQAFAWFENTLEIEPYEGDALQGLARAAQALGREDEARQARRRVRLLTSPCDGDASSF
jgi:tetratricopeptide (TPR) repeat protein